MSVQHLLYLNVQLMLPVSAQLVPPCDCETAPFEFYVHLLLHLSVNLLNMCVHLIHMSVNLNVQHMLHMSVQLVPYVTVKQLHLNLPLCVAAASYDCAAAPSE